MSENALNPNQVDQLSRLVMRTPEGGELRRAELLIVLEPGAGGMSLHVRRIGVTNHLLRDMILGLFLSLAPDDRRDALNEIAVLHCSRKEVAPWSSQTIAEKLRGPAPAATPMPSRTPDPVDLRGGAAEKKRLGRIRLREALTTILIVLVWATCAVVGWVLFNWGMAHP